MKVAYYKGCLASLSAKELDTSTQALAPKLGIVQGERALARIEHVEAEGARRDAPEITPGEEPPVAEG